MLPRWKAQQQSSVKCHSRLMVNSLQTVPVKTPVTGFDSSFAFSTSSLFPRNSLLSIASQLSSNGYLHCILSIRFHYNSISCNLLRPCSRDRYVSDLFWSRQACDTMQCECSAATFRMWTHINSGRGCHPLVSTDTIQCLFPRTNLLFLSSLSSLLFVKIRGWSWNAFESMVEIGMNEK